ncbi:ubiquitin-protein transferase [Aureococcus anophagefferens]|nr:ubiquitin-protein transferase [Aureococcus anophagefferens]
MNLGDLWGWEKRKLGCRIRAETQNPALDEIRERLSKMSGVDVPELDGPSKAQRRPQTTGAGKALRTGRVRDELSRPTTAALGDGAAGGLTASSTGGDHVFPPYHGDLFMTRGVYMGGIIYQSRLQDHAEGGRRRKGPGEDAERDREEAAKLLAAKLKAEEEERLRLSVPAKRDDPKAHEAKLHCANSLASWSTHAENAARLAEEGAVSAALVLSKDENADVRRACATAFKNMSQHAELCAQLVKHTAVPAKLVEDGVVIALMSLMNQHEELAELCSRGLFNLTCVDQPYMYMERVIKAFVSLASSTMAAVKHVCAAALCNLSDIKAVRSRIVEEGVVQVVGLLARGAEARTRRVCAIVLHSLASTRTCRADMVSKGAVQVLYALSSDVDTITLHYIASAIIRLAMEDQNLPRLVHEGGVTALCNICLAGARPRASAACPPAIPAIIALSRLPEPRTRMRCAATLCKLASVEANVGLMVEEGVVPAFIDMLQTRDQEIVKHCCAALCRLAHEGSSAVTIAEGAVPHVIAGCGEGSDAATRQSCCAVLSAVSAHEPCRRPLCAMGTLGALVALARDRAADDTTRLRCAVAFANLSHEPTVQGEMVAAGIVPVVAELSNSYCEENQLYCARALCNLGCHAGSEEAIVKQGGVAALMMICMVRAVSHLTKQVCAKALLNLLCTPAVRENWLPALAKEGLVQACSVLSRLSEEETMRVCASIFCTLSAQGPAGRAPGRAAVDAAGRLRLMRSRDRTTQVVCGKTACNLLGHVDSQQPAVRAGAVSVLTSLCTLGDPEAEVAAADAYFLIAGDEACRLEMVEAKVLPVLITNARSPNGPTRQSCLRVLAHLAWWKNVWKSNIQPDFNAEPAGDADAAAPASGAGGRSRGGDAAQDLTLYIFTYMTFASEDHRVAMAREELASAGLVPLLIRLSRHGDDKVASSCSEALKNLSSGGSGGIEEGTVSTLIAMTLSGGPSTNAAALDADSAFEPHTVSVMKMVGGIAGAGPPPPEPPEMDVQDTLNLSFLDSGDALEDDENMGASMMFAKITADASSSA